MKLILCDVNFFYVPLEHIGLTTITAYLRKFNIDVCIQNFDGTKTSQEIAREFPLDYNIYGFTLYHTNIELVFELSKFLKDNNKNCKIFVGGYLATDAYELILEDCPEIDFVTLGFGEIPIYNLVKYLEEGKDISKLESVVTRNDINKKLPCVEVPEGIWPVRDMLLDSIKRGYYTARILTSRGCCNDCTFCSANRYSKLTHSKRWHGRDMKDVYSEIEMIHKTYGIRSFTFNDNSFEDPGKLGKERIREFCNYVINHQYGSFCFWCFLRANTFHEEDVELIKIMKQAGFSQIYIGIEAGNESDLKLYSKNASVEDNERSIKLFKENGIDVDIGFIMINPLSTKQTIKENYNFLKKCKIHSFDNYTRQIWVLYKSELYYICKEKKLLGDGYTYRQPVIYKYADSYIEELSIFLNEVVINNEIYDRYLEEFNLHNMIYSLNSLFPTKATKYIDELNEIEELLSEELACYFKYLYEDYNIPKAREEYENFSRNIISIYERSSILKLKVARNPIFRDYLTGKSIKKTIKEHNPNVKK